VPLYFLAATVFMTWPAVLHLADAVVGQLGDNMHFAWLMGWFDQAIFQQGRWPFFAPQLNYPEGWQLARSETTPLQAAMGLPFTWIGGPLLAYNVVALLSFFLSGLTSYLWVRRLTGDRLASLLAGTLFAFLPFRIAHFRSGHLNILGTMWFPLFFMALFAALKSGHADRRDIVLGGISLGLISLTSQYYFYVTVVTAGFVAAAYLLLFARDRLRDRGFWSSMLGMGAAAAPLVALAILPYLQLAAQDSLPDRPVEAVSLGSAGLSDFLLPSTDHFLWGEWVGEIRPPALDGGDSVYGDSRGRARSAGSALLPARSPSGNQAAAPAAAGRRPVGHGDSPVLERATGEGAAAGTAGCGHGPGEHGRALAGRSSLSSPALLCQDSHLQAGGCAGAAGVLHAGRPGCGLAAEAGRGQAANGPGRGAAGACLT
jgi:hypothetical protein